MLYIVFFKDDSDILHVWIISDVADAKASRSIRFDCGIPGFCKQRFGVFNIVVGSICLA